MDSSWITNLLPFWILGVPLIVSIISYMRMPRQRDLARPDRTRDRPDKARESHIRAGDATVSRG
jgi:hypothetical protein